MKTASPIAQPFLEPTKALACIHCGLCLGSCPTYLETGNENESPRGRIYLMRALEQGRVPLNAEAVRHIDLCLGCRACETACPSGVEYGSLLEATRDHIEREYRRPARQSLLRRWFIEAIFPFPKRLKAALWPAQVIRKLQIDSFLPRFARNALELVPAISKESALPNHVPAAVQPTRGTVGFISGCVMSVLFGRTNHASVKLLSGAGFDVRTPSTQACCGALHAHSGQLQKARESARHNIAAFEAAGLDQMEAVIINAAGCGSTLKEYAHLLHDDPAWAERARAFSAKVKDLTEFLAAKEFKGGRSHFKRVTYHDACHLAHPQHITRSPRQLIRSVAGPEYIELPEAEVCCGSAGSYNLTEPEMAQRLQNRKTEHILSTGADAIITTNPGCILQIQAGLKKAGAHHVRVFHLAEYLLESIRQNPNDS